jgi:hypothetical protein
MYFIEIGWEGVYWIHMAQDRGKCQVLVNTGKKLGFHKWWVISRVAELVKKDSPPCS